MESPQTASQCKLPRGVDPEGFCHDQGWTDGLPVVAPTPARVKGMLATVERDPQELLGVFLPLRGQVTVEKIAANAVLAGCLPEHFPVVLTAISCLAAQEDRLGIFLTTIHGDSPLVIINGPVVKESSFNAGSNVFGPGYRANATVGRAISLALRNIALGPPGKYDEVTFAHPGKYSYCIAEYEGASPWAPFHVDRGFKETESTVTVVGAQAPLNVADMVSTNPDSLLTTIADAMAIRGSYNAYFGGETLVVLSPTHARILADGGLSKADVQQALFERARRPLKDLRGGGSFDFGNVLRWPDWVDTSDDEFMVPIAHRPEDVLILVAGGRIGSYSCVVFCFHGFPSITLPIERG